MAIDFESSSALSSLAIDSKQPEKAKSNELGRDAFLKLMITQMNNQNPLQPQEGSDFVAQLAQFSSVEGLEKLNGNVEAMAGNLQSSQALQASALVGRQVKIQSEQAQLAQGGSVAGTIEVPFSTSGVSLSVYNSTNELVWKQDLGAQAAGELEFDWEGIDADGQTLPAGSYRFEAIGSREGETAKFATFLGANVNSVTLGANNTVTMNVEGVGAVGLSQVKEIL